VVSNSRTAEIIKLTDNMQRDAIFAVSNHVAEVCNLNGVRAKEVIQLGTLGYSRNKLFSPGPVGGPCLEKDSYIFSESLPFERRETSLALVARKTNEEVLSNAMGLILKEINVNFKNEKTMVAILGMAFKGTPETDDLRGSPSIEFIKLLQQKSDLISISTWDPLVGDISFKGVKHYENINDAVNGANAVVLMNNHISIGSLDLHEISKKLKDSAVIYDFWDRYDPLQKLNNSVKYFAWGYHQIRVNN
jgi:nucleotide sugar dehydrogenase